jgi:Icc-related predicted phosphoesterase
MRANLQRVTKEVRHLGVIGDVHARIDLLQRASDALDTAGVDILVCVGDIYAQRAGRPNAVDSCAIGGSKRFGGIMTVGSSMLRVATGTSGPLLV